MSQVRRLHKDAQKGTVSTPWWRLGERGPVSSAVAKAARGDESAPEAL